MKTVKEMRSVLAYLGIDYADQPTKVGELKFVLSQYAKLDTDKYNTAIAVVINGEAEREAIPKEYESHEDFIVKRVNEHAKRISEELTSSANDIYESMDDRSASAIIEFIGKSDKKLAELALDVKQLWEDEVKKYRRIIVEQPSKGKKVELKGILPDEFEDLLDLADMRENIMMVGPAGSGKTYLAGELAKALDLPFGSQSCSAGISESVFIGWLLPTGDNGKFNHVTSQFLEIYEKGGIFLLDEMDAADPNVLTFLNQALANGGFYLPQRFGKTWVQKHPDFVAVSACNTFGQGADAMYHARNALDGATLDRFKMGMTVIDYSDKVEESLITETSVLQWGREVRGVINKNNLNKIMSTRTLIGANKMFNGKHWDINKIATKYFSDWSKEEKAIMKSNGINIGSV